MHQQWAYTIILPLVLVQTGALSNLFCPNHCLCNKTMASMYCDGNGVLRYIPKPPNYIRYFQLANTNLEQMTKASMANLTRSRIYRIRLVNNKIDNISPDALSDLKYLRVLDWRQGYFPMSEFCLALQYSHCYLYTLRIRADKVDTDTVSASSFKNASELRILRLSLQNMRNFNTTGLNFLKRLSQLDLSNNRLLDFSIVDIVSNMKKLSLSQNNFDSIPMLCSDTHRPLLPKLAHFNIQDNTIRVLNTSGISCLEHLDTLILDHNRIKHLCNNSFASLPALKALHLSSVTTLQHIDELAFNSSSLNELYLTHNPRLTRNNFNPKLLFTFSHNLERLDMSSTKRAIETEDLKDFLLSLKHINYLRLVKSSISTLPSGVFCHLTNLTHLLLTSNLLVNWDKGVFANVTSIKHIYFGDNQIKVVNESSFPVEFRLSVKEIDLSKNPYSCLCDLLWFRNWMKDVLANKSIVFTNYPDLYFCSIPTYGLRLDAYNPTLESCNIDQPYLVYLVMFLSVCICCIVAALVTYRYRWYILYWISLMRKRRQRKCQDPPAEMQYDGFVSYSNPDWDWVSAELMHFLENDVGLHLCEHSRDFKSGMYIVDNIIEAIDSSRKTILVISNEYVKSDWCQFELQMVLSSFLNKEIEIVVILLEEIQSRHVTSSLRALMVSTTYLQWSDDPEAKRLFKAKLENAMLCAM